MAAFRKDGREMEPSRFDELTKVLAPSYNWLILVFGEALGESFHRTSSSQTDMRSLSVMQEPLP
jgi:hypothetical protein